MEAVERLRVMGAGVVLVEEDDEEEMGGREAFASWWREGDVCLRRG